MTTLQEAARKSFEAWKKTGSCFYLSRNNAPGSDLDGYQDAYTQGQWVAWQAALAQQEGPEVLAHDNCRAERICRSWCGNSACVSHTAAPAPQAQDPIAKLFGTLPVYDTPAPQPAQGEPTGCACRWDADDNRVATCARHQGWLDVVHEWAERAKATEAALQSTQPLRELTDEEILALEREIPARNYAGAEWIYFARAVLKKARE